MRLFASVVIVVVAMLSLGATVSTQTDQKAPWGFAVVGDDGQPQVMAAFRPEPYKPGFVPRVFIGSVGFYGWMEGATVRVAVLRQVPPQGTEKRFEQVSVYTLSAAKPTPVAEAKDLGIDPCNLVVQATAKPTGR